MIGQINLSTSSLDLPDRKSDQDAKPEVGDGQRHSTADTTAIPCACSKQDAGLKHDALAYVVSLCSKRRDSSPQNRGL